MIIGIYKLWSMFSYIGLLFGIISIYFSSIKDFKLALLFLMLSSLIDVFDGTFARQFKRSQSEERFGIELDSILDTINFGIVPIIIFFNMDFISIYDYIIAFIYLFVVTMRLAFFNTELVNLKGKNKKYEIYYGFPVTAISMFMAFGYILHLITNINYLMQLTIIVSSLLFITRIKIKRYKCKWFNIILIGIALLMIALMFNI